LHGSNLLVAASGGGDFGSVLLAPRRVCQIVYLPAVSLNHGVQLIVPAALKQKCVEQRIRRASS
jgi:hypothetical protein